MEPSSVRIYIRCPSPHPHHSLDNFHLDIPISSTVATLKQNLSTSHPLFPPIDDQRLIYNGHVLKDEDLLSSVVRDQSVVTFHMVLRSGNYNGIIQEEHQIIQQEDQIIRDQQVTPANRRHVWIDGLPYRIENLPQQQQQQQQHPVPRPIREFRFTIRLNIWLVVRTILMVYLFTQGVSGWKRLVVFVFGLIYFLHQSGWLPLLPTHNGLIEGLSISGTVAQGETRGILEEFKIFLSSYVISMLPGWEQPVNVENM